MTLPHAVVIAGGQGERLGGVRKTDLRIGGQQLLDRLVGALGAVAAPVMVATGPAGAGRAQWLPEGVVAVPDIGAQRAGPLAGLAAAIADLRSRGVTSGVLVSVAVDTPLLPADYVPRLLAALEGVPATFAARGDDFYPTNAAWRIEAIADLPERMADDPAPHSLKALLAALEARRVGWDAADGSNPFANINTVADLIALGRRIKA